MHLLELLAHLSTQEHIPVSSHRSWLGIQTLSLIPGNLLIKIRKINVTGDLLFVNFELLKLVFYGFGTLSM